ncbi:methyltransferase domain-containing protein [Oceanotoga sp. DSM 15011]|uniref:class I SAM-dependent methyltransferase n=1 Tax=Oceanotoga sp. DSM 15011 TaxID=2984951 RepID=UPI0021F4A80F|nr:class I SAM-dependent methyltransferase [Oceanotoga sp. DSM 15011]UYO99769.1 methyltransferase domain-containing protein [Oceanotoga sp. DSM 15011]
MKKVRKYYDDFVEEEWMRLDKHKIEFEITKRNMKKYIKNNSRILDIGSGPGRYSIYLSQLGHKVTCVDISQNNLIFAKKKAEHFNVEIEKFINTDAINLNMIEDESYDVVLNMGPMYHIMEVENRRESINESLRVLKRGGILFVSFISSYAPIIDCLKKYPENIKTSEDLLNYLKDGKNISDDLNLGFTDAYFINPHDIRPFMDLFLINELKLTAIEGLSALQEEKLNNLDESAFEKWIDIIYKTSTDPLTWASSEHMLYIGKKK